MPGLQTLPGPLYEKAGTGAAAFHRKRALCLSALRRCDRDGKPLLLELRKGGGMVMAEWLRILLRALAVFLILDSLATTNRILREILKIERWKR